MKIIFCSLVILLLVSCAGNAPETITSSLETPTSNPPVTATELFPTRTPSPTPLPTNTPIALLPVYQFPSWMGDPATNILAALITDDVARTRKISFFNVTTGESYEILMPRDVSGYFWYDNANFGFLSKDMEKAHRINLPTGKVSTEPVSAQVTQFLTGEYEYDDYENSYKDTANTLELTKDTNTNEALFRRTRYGEYGTRSRNGRFSADWDENRTGIIVMDNKTNQILWESQPFQDTYGTIFRWSPKNESQLAYLQGRPAEPFSDFVTEEITLTIVDVVSGKVLGSYAGDFGIIEWSPDGKKIIYQDSRSIYHNYGVGFTDAPCILFLELGEKRCLRSIPRLVPEGYDLLTTGIYKWGSNNDVIYFTYIYEKDGDRVGNLCMYSLITSYINCPTDHLEALNGMTVGNHEVSPDQQFIHFCYSASSILNDYADTASDAVIKTDGTGFFSWVGAIHDGGPYETCSIGTLWRPLP